MLSTSNEEEIYALEEESVFRNGNRAVSEKNLHLFATNDRLGKGRNGKVKPRMGNMDTFVGFKLADDHQI